MQAQLYSLARESDPWHIFAGAVTGLMVSPLPPRDGHAIRFYLTGGAPTQGWWFSDVGVGFLPPSPGVLSQPVLRLGSQPTTQLSIDLPLMENYPHSFAPGCSEDGCLLDFADGDALLTQGLKLDPVGNSAGGVGTATVYPSPTAFRSVLWLGLIEAGMSHQLAFIFGPYGEANGAHEEYTSQVGQFGRELTPLLPAIHRSVASEEPLHPGTTVTGGGSLGYSSRAWRLGNAENLRIHAVVVNLSPAPVTFSLTVDAPELTDGQWVATRDDGGERVIKRGAMSDSLGSNATGVYTIAPVRLSEIY